MFLEVTYSWHVVIGSLLGLIHIVNCYCSNNDQLAITRCAQPLYDVGAFRTDSKSQTFSWDLFTRNELSYFGEVCDAFIRFDLCTHSYKEQCFHEEPIQSQYQTATSVLDYLCHEGYREMMHNFQCIVTILRDEAMTICQNEMSRAMHEIPAHLDEPGKEAHVCRTMQSYMRCMKTPFVNGCGIRAWTVVRDVVQRPTTLMIPDCKISNAVPNVPCAYLVFISICVVFYEILCIL